MKSLNVLKVAVLALPLLVASCGTKKKAVDTVTKSTTVLPKDSAEQQQSDRQHEQQSGDKSAAFLCCAHLLCPLM